MVVGEVVPGTDGVPGAMNKRVVKEAE